jgi:CBS domain-containing protein
MSLTVREVMNRELFAVRPGDTIAAARDGILALGITGAPVLDGDGRPIGFVSLRDLVDAGGGATAGERMRSPALVVGEHARIVEAAHLLCEAGHRRLVVVDAAGRVVGMVSAVDLLRAIIGLPARHPAPFPHLDPRTGVAWTDDAELTPENVELAPDGPGLLVFLREVPGVPDRIIRVESCAHVRTRLHDLLSFEQDDPEVRRLLALPDLRFRTAAVTDDALRERLHRELRA